MTPEGKLQLVVAVVTATLGLVAGAVHETTDGAARALWPVVAAWVAAPVALLLEPRGGARAGRVAIAAAGAAAVGAAVALVLATRQVPPWWQADREVVPLGTQLACAAWLGRGVAAWWVLTITALPAPLLLLALRRLGRQLEWQVAAAALGPVLVSVALFPDQVEVCTVWIVALAGAPVGVGAYLVDQHLLGSTGVAAFPDAEPVRERALLRRTVLPIVAFAGLGWSVVWGHAGAALAPRPLEPGRFDVEALLEDVRARQERHRARTGEYARTLLELGVDPDVAGGYAHGHVIRFGRIDLDAWAIAADPAPARMGWPSLRLVVRHGAPSEVEAGSRPFSLVGLD